MPDTPQTSGERHIDRLLRELDPGSDRYLVLESAKRFKSSWVELGNKLLVVSSSSLYRDWGYSSFDEYCAREIRIKKPTAEKLTLAYRFMEKEEPELMERSRDLRPLPDYRSVDLLRQAREERNFSDEEYGELRKSVIEEERSHPTVLKRFKEMAREEEQPRDPAASARGALLAARRLDAVLADLPQVAEEFSGSLMALVSRLEEELEAAKMQEVPL